MHLAGLAERSGARGVVVHVVKFCEPELFDVPAIRRTFEALAGDDRRTSLLPLVDMMSTGWHGLTSAGTAPGARSMPPAPNWASTWHA